MDTNNFSAKLEVLYDVEWQKLRVSILGSWTKGDSALECAKKLETYVSLATTEEEELRRCWRVVNYYNATRMGFHGMGIVGSVFDKLLLTERSVYQDKMQALQAKGVSLGRMDWSVIESELLELFSYNRKVFDDIYLNLIKRVKHALKKIGSLKYRSELDYFLSLMEDIKKGGKK